MCHCTWGPFLTDQQTQLVLSPLEKSICVFFTGDLRKGLTTWHFGFTSVWIPRLRKKYWSFLCVLLNNQCRIELNWPWIYLHFSVVSILNAVAGQWLFPLLVNPYPTRDCLRVNNPIKWRTRKFHHIHVNSRYRSPFITSSLNSNWSCNSVVNKSMSLPPPLT